jgi:hypothetical protein
MHPKDVRDLGTSDDCQPFFDGVQILVEFQCLPRSKDEVDWAEDLGREVDFSHVTPLNDISEPAPDAPQIISTSRMILLNYIYTIKYPVFTWAMRLELNRHFPFLQIAHQVMEPSLVYDTVFAARNNR